MNNEFYLSDAIGVIEEVLASGGEFRLYPKGTSMLPLLVQGKDSVILRRDPERKIRKHDILFYLRDDGHFVLHRAMKLKKDGTFTMCGDNQTLLETGIRADQIIGYVSAVYKKDRLLKLSSFKYRTYVAFWCFMPLRRTIRFARACLGKIKRVLLRIFKKRG